MLIKYRKQNPFVGPFFKLCISEGFADLGVFSATMFLNLFRTWGWIDFERFYRSSLIFRPLFFVGYLFGQAQVVGVAIMAFNRFDSVVRRERLVSCVCTLDRILALQILTLIITLYAEVIKTMYNFRNGPIKKLHF